MRYLKLSKTGIWVFRFQIPKSKRHHFENRYEVKKHLKATTKAQAQLQALQLELEIRGKLTSSSPLSNEAPPLQYSLGRTRQPKTKHSPFKCLEDYKEYKSSYISNKSIMGAVAKCKLVLILSGQDHISAIRRADAERVRQLLTKLPSNIKKHRQFSGLSPSQAITLNEKLQLPTISQNSVKDYIQKASSFFEWCVQMELTNVNPFKGFKFRSDKKISQSKHAYSNEDLRKLFSSSIYLNHDFKHPYQFWLPLLGLYTGARLNELCQLHTNDVVKINNVWCISINSDTSDKRLKNVNSERLIPIHRTLKELGFIDFAKKRPSQRIFDELKLERDGYGTSPSKWFGRYKSSLGFTRGYDFHSLRHTFASSLKNALIPEVLANELLGHTQSTISYERYGKEIDISTKADAVNSISSISSKHIKRFFRLPSLKD